jgi:hypothetical protein
MAARDAVPLTSRLLWRVPLSPPTPQYARAALAQGRNPQALPRLGVLHWRSRASMRSAPRRHLGENRLRRAFRLPVRCLFAIYKSLMFRQRKGCRVA